MGELVMYENAMNKLMLGSLSKTSTNIFYALCYKMKNQGSNRIIMDFSEVKELAKYKHNGNSDKNFISDLDKMTDELLMVNSRHIIKKPSGKRKIYKFDIFPTFIIDEEKKTLEVGVNPDFQWLLNEFKQYTSFELEDMVGLKSKYAKHLFRLLRQWKSVGKLVVGEGGQEPSIKEFRRKIGVRDSYTTKEMIRSCIDVAVDQINRSKCSITGLKCEKTYANRRGRPLSQLIFTWQREEKKDPEDEKDDVYNAVFDMLKDYPEVTEENIRAIAKAARKNNVTSITEIQKRIKDALSRKEKGKNIPNLTGYIISLMKKYDDPAKNRNTTNAFNNFEQNTYDFDELEKDILDNPIDNGRPKKKDELVEKLSDLVKKDSDLPDLEIRKDSNLPDFAIIDGSAMAEHEAYGYSAEKMAEGVKLIIEMMKSNS